MLNLNIQKDIFILIFHKTRQKPYQMKCKFLFGTEISFDHELLIFKNINYKLTKEKGHYSIMLFL